MAVFNFSKLVPVSVCCILAHCNGSLGHLTTTNFEPTSYTLKMPSFEDNLVRATRQACLVLSGNDLQRICLCGLYCLTGTLWDQWWGFAMDKTHTGIHGRTVTEGSYHVDAPTVLLSSLRIPHGGSRNYAL